MSQKKNLKADSPSDELSSSSELHQQYMADPQQQKSRNRSVGFLVVIPALFGLWLVITSLTEVVPELGIYDGKRILELYLISLTLLVLILSTQIRQKLKNILQAIPAWVRILLLFFFGLGLSSALLTPNPGYPLLDVAMLFLIVFTTFSLACIRQLIKVILVIEALARF